MDMIIGIVGMAFFPGSHERFADACLPLSLQRESGSKYNPHAIAVFSGEHQVGLLRRGDAAKLAPKMDLGSKFRVDRAPEFPLSIRVSESGN